MPLAEAQDLRNLSVDELRMKRQALEKGLNELRTKKITGQLDKPHEFKRVRRQIAQINTVEREKQNAGNTVKK